MFGDSELATLRIEHQQVALVWGLSRRAKCNSKSEEEQFLSVFEAFCKFCKLRNCFCKFCKFGDCELANL
jgi:hypothetical protein